MIGVSNLKADQGDFDVSLFQFHSETADHVRRKHDDVKWKHFPRYWPFVRGMRRSPVNSPQKGQWRGALMFSLICTRINGWVNNREAGDLRRYRAHYDVTVMKLLYPSSRWLVSWAHEQSVEKATLHYIWCRHSRLWCRHMRETASQITGNVFILFRLITKGVLMVRVTGPLWREPPLTGGFSTCRVTDAGNHELLHCVVPVAGSIHWYIHRLCHCREDNVFRSKCYNSFYICSGF